VLLNLYRPRIIAHFLHFGKFRFKMLITVISVCIFASLCIAAPTEEKDPMLGDHFQGDILLPEGKNVQNGIRGENYRWPDKTIPYVIDPNFSSSDKNVINNAIQEIRQKTCLKFVVRSNQKDYVYIRKGADNSGCNAHVGRQGGQQVVNLQANGCVYKGIVGHELIHAIGFFHEQSRSDRDDYVTINYPNIQDEYRFAFDKLDTDNFGVTYDYGSLMHYGAYDFAKDRNQKTIITKGGQSIGQRNGLSNLDATKIKKMYKC